MKSVKKAHLKLTQSSNPHLIKGFQNWFKDLYSKLKFTYPLIIFKIRSCLRLIKRHFYDTWHKKETITKYQQKHNHQVYLGKTTATSNCRTTSRQKPSLISENRTKTKHNHNQPYTHKQNRRIWCWNRQRCGQKWEERQHQTKNLVRQEEPITTRTQNDSQNTPRNRSRQWDR